jgi:hypothetical protein
MALATNRDGRYDDTVCIDSGKSIRPSPLRRIRNIHMYTAVTWHFLAHNDDSNEVQLHGVHYNKHWACDLRPFSFLYLVKGNPPAFKLPFATLRS